MSSLIEDKKLVLGFVGVSIVTWNLALKLHQLLKERNHVEWIPVGRVKSLHVYPIKSCKGKQVFSFNCTPLGAKSGEYLDRFFVVINGQTGRFYTARGNPTMVLVNVDIENGVLRLSHPQAGEATVDLRLATTRNNVRSATLHASLRTDGLDCGDEAAEFFSRVVEEPGARLLMYKEGLFTERTCVPSDDWWNNPVPKRVDNTAFADLAPYMVTTQGSLDDLNSRLDRSVSSINFRPVIVVDDCPAWDEDCWAEIRIGDAQLECFKPCTRCVLTTVDPETGVKDVDVQPLNKLKEYRMAPDGKMRKSLKDSPIFGVNAGLVKQGYVHVGQTVWARYKPSVF